LSQNHSLSLRDYLADTLQRCTEQIVQEWIEWLHSRVGTRTIHALPERALRDHIPPVLRSISSFLRAPIEAVRSETMAHLRLHAQIRQQQGYDIQELLLELDYLANMVGAHLAEAIKDFPETVEPIEIAEAYNLLHAGLRAMSFVTVGVYRDREDELSNELSARLEEFAHNLSHELRQPLDTANLGSEMLAREEVAQNRDNRSRYIELIQKSIRRTTDLLEEVRLLALSEGARTEQRWITLKMLIEQVYDELGPEAERRNVQLVLEESLPDIELDSVRIHVAILNLVANSIKYSDPDKPAQWVKISAHWEPEANQTGACTIKVQDNGLGIGVEAQDHVFQRHFRAHPERGEGAGLGLAITQHTLAQIGGTIWLESEPKKGSVFFLRVSGRGARVAGQTTSLERPREFMQRSVEATLDSNSSVSKPQDTSNPETDQPQ
jgi:signal transduction histidine kinase